MKAKAGWTMVLKLAAKHLLKDDISILALPNYCHQTYIPRPNISHLYL